MSGSRSIGSLIVELAAKGSSAYKADVDAAAGATDKAAKSADDLKGALNRQATAANAADAAMKVLASAATYAASAFAAWKVVDLVRDSAMAAARFETMGVVMKVAGNNAGYSAQKMQEYSAELQKSGISMLQSRNALTQLATANIDLANASKLARAAQDLAVVGNVNSSEALGRLIGGIKSGEVEVLKSLGLNVSFEASYKKLAAQLGTTSEKLTEQQKLLARTEVALDGAARYTGIYEESLNTAGKAMGSLTRYWEDFQAKAGEAFLPALATSVFTLTDALKAMNKELEAAGQQGLLADVGALLNGVLTKAFQTVAVLGANVVFVFKGIGREIGAMAAQAAAVARGDFKAAFGIGGIGDMVTQDAERARAALDAFEKKVLGVGQATAKVAAQDRLRTRSERDAADALAAQEAAAAAALSKKADASKAAAKAAQDEAAILAKLSGYTADYEKTIQTYVAMRDKGTLSEEAYTRAVLELVQTQPGAVAATRALTAATAAQAKADEAAFKAALQNAQARDKVIEAMGEDARKIEEENAGFNLNERALAGLTAARLTDQAVMLEAQAVKKLDRDLDYEAYNATMRLAEAIRAKAVNTLTKPGIDAAKDLADANKKAAEESAKYWEDALMRAFESGKGFFESLWSTIKNTLKTQVLKVGVQAVMGTLGLGAAGVAGAADGTLGIASTVGALANLPSTIGTLTTAVTSLPSLLASSSMGALDIAGFAAGPVGLAVAAAAALYAIFGNKKTPSAGTGEGNAMFDAAGNVTDASSRYTGGWGLTDQVGTTLADLQASYAGAARALGIATVATEFAFGGNTGKEGKDPQFALGVNAGGVSYSSGEIKLTDANVQLAASRAVFAALQGSDLPAYLVGAFDDLVAASATQEQITGALNQASAVKTFHDAVQSLPFDGLKNLSFDASVALGQASGGLDVLVASLTDMQAASATARAGIAALVDGIDAKVSDSIFGMQYGLEDDAGKYNMLDVRAARLNDQMLASTDLAAVAKLAEEQIATINQAWGLLSDEQQRSKYMEFESRLNKVDDLVTARGADALSLQQAADDRTAKTIADAVEAAVAKALANPAAAMQAAADKADKPIEVVSNVSVTVTAPAGSEVSITQ